MKTTFAKHKKMRDVCCELLDQVGPNAFRVAWMNLRGTFDHPKPYYMARNSKSLAMEIINITTPEDWKFAKSPEELK